MDQAEDTLSDISDFIETLIKGKEDILSVKGTELLANIKTVRAELGQYDVRSIDLGGSTLTEALEEFLRDGNQDEEQNNAFIWRMLSKKIKSLKEQFEQDWNCSKEKKIDEKNDEKNESKEVVVYKKVTPLKKKAQYVCPDCPPTAPAFTNCDAYRRHVKKEHKKDVKPDQPKVRCMLQDPNVPDSQCKSRLPRKEMYRHFEDTHKLEKKSNRKCRLKYFKSLNGGLTYVEPVFVGADGVPEPDPKYILHDIDEEEDVEETTGNVDTDIAAAEVRPHSVQDVSNEGCANMFGKSLEVSQEIEEKDEEIVSNIMKENNMESEPPVKKAKKQEVAGNELIDNSLGTPMAVILNSSLDTLETKKPTDDFNLPTGLVISPAKSVEKEEYNKDKEEIIQAPGQSKSIDDQLWMPDSVPISEDDSPLKVIVDDDSHEKFHVNDDSATKVVVDDDPSNKVIVNEEKFNVGGRITVNEDRMETDSDFDDADSEDFKSKLIDNRTKRYEDRNEEIQSDDVASLPENSDFMTEMDTWLKDVKYAANARDAQNIRGKMRGHISNHPHSLLRYEHSKDPQFHLGRYVCFTDSSQLLELSDPIPWIRSLGGKDGTEQPSKQKELLKCFARLRDFILFKMQSTKFGTDYQDLQRKRDLRQNLLDLEDHIKRSNFSETLDKLINVEAEKRKNAKAQLNPNLSKNEVNAVKTWLTSEEWAELRDANIAIWEKATTAASSLKANKESRKKSKKRNNSGEDCEDKGLEDETEQKKVSSRKRRKPMRYQSADEEVNKHEVEELASSDKGEMKSSDSVIKPEGIKSKEKVGCGSSSNDKGEMKSSDSVIIKPKDFTAFGAFTQHTLAVKDKNRTSCYNFSNGQFIMAQKLWFPPNFSPDDFDGFPDDWDCNQEPSPPRPHDALQIRLDGNTPGLKGSTGAFVTIEGVALDLVEKYRDLKAIVFGATEDPNKPFFCNYYGKPLSSLSKNSQGSLWHKFAQVTGLDSATQNSVRRGFESYVQKSKISRKRVQALNNHSDSVGLKFYDGEAGTFRSGVVHTLSQMEAAEGNDDRNSNVMISEEVAEKRKKIDAEDEKLRKIIIGETMAKSNQKEKYKLGATMKVLPSDRQWVQRFLTDERYQHFHGIIKGTRFPGNKEFKKCFYRMVDSEVTEMEDRVAIREIERRIFEAVKEDVKKDFNGEWCGSLSQNKKGDRIVAEKIRNSLRIYEQKVKSNPALESYFTFK